VNKDNIFSGFYFGGSRITRNSLRKVILYYEKETLINPYNLKGKKVNSEVLVNGLIDHR